MGGPARRSYAVSKWLHWCYSLQSRFGEVFIHISNQYATIMQRIKHRITEGIKYDWRWAKVIPMYFISLVVFVMCRLRADSLAFRITSLVYQMGWPNSKKIRRDTTNLLFKDDQDRGARLLQQHVDQIKIPEKLSKYEQDPVKLF